MPGALGSLAHCGTRGSRPEEQTCRPRPIPSLPKTTLTRTLPHSPIVLHKRSCQRTAFLRDLHDQSGGVAVGEAECGAADATLVTLQCWWPVTCLTNRRPSW